MNAHDERADTDQNQPQEQGHYSNETISDGWAFLESLIDKIPSHRAPCPEWADKLWWDRAALEAIFASVRDFPEVRNAIAEARHWPPETKIQDIITRAERFLEWARVELHKYDLPETPAPTPPKE